MINSDKRVLLGKLSIGREKVGVCTTCPAMQQQQRWCRWVAVLKSPHKKLAPVFNRDDLRIGQPWQ
jgi:hypothetical protein